MDEATDAWYRSRGFDALESRFGPKIIETFIAQRLEARGSVRVLEVGFGEGRCLLDLRERFTDPRVELHGINDRAKGRIRVRSDLRASAEEHGVPMPANAIPHVAFYDAGSGLRFEDGALDAIISQVSVHYISDKAWFIEEAWRVLAEDGRAYLHLDTIIDDRFPDFMRLCRDTPRFVVYERGRLVSTETIVTRARSRGFELRLERSKLRPENIVLVMRKNRRSKLRLGLTFDAASTLSLTALKGSDPAKGDPAVWWGTRSVYRTSR